MSDDENLSDPGTGRDRPDPEGVRIIGAEEAAEALGRDDIAHRRAPEEPRPGDRPGSPPPDAPEPVLRFPLSSSATEEPSAELPHWTEPPTGQQPALGGTIFDDDQGEEDWSGFSAAPRWRDEGDQWSDEEDLRSFGGDDTRVGALDTDRPDPDDFFTFDDLDAPPAGRSVFDDAGVVGPMDDERYDDDLVGVDEVGYDDAGWVEPDPSGQNPAVATMPRSAAGW